MRLPDPVQRTFAICRFLIWLAGWLAPANARPSWRERRTVQVWHWCQFLGETGQLNRTNRLELARFCWGAFPAAFWTRFDQEKFHRRQDRLLRSPGFCLTAIAAAALVLMLVGGIIPVLRSFSSSAIPDPDHVCVISLNGKFRRVRSETLLDLASAWKGSKTQ